MTAQKRLKVLLCCYACDPNLGSEPGMGWNFVTNIAKFHDVHAIVEEEKFKANLTQYATAHPEAVRNITFHFIPKDRHRILRRIWPPSYYWFYRKWNKRAYKLAVELDKQEHFDIVHQITLAGYREPGFLWKLGKPFIWGPIGGFSQTSWSLLKGTDLHNIVYFGLRNIINYCQKRWGYAGRKVAPNAHTILISDKQGINDVLYYWNQPSEHMLEVGTYPCSAPDTIINRHAEDTFRICWVGHLIPLKSLEILLHAIALCRTKKLHLEVLGKGPCLQKWQTLAAKLRIETKVTFHGYTEHSKTLNTMQKSHVFCHTSIKEGGTGTVILEALQCGLPIIALDHCGQAAVIDESCGFKIPIRSRQQIIENIAEKLDFLANNEDFRFSLAVGALNRSKLFSWNAKMQQLNHIYEAASKSRIPQI